MMFICMAVLPLLPWRQAAIRVFIAAGFGVYMFHTTLQECKPMVF